jgi:D-serine deaminase-like pyridoxal phosphate-dependent protein
MAAVAEQSDPTASPPAAPRPAAGALPPTLGGLETPALLLDEARLEANLARMADLCAENGRALRPHAKSHKTVEIARRQVELGAVGVTVAKLGEAEVYVEAGIEDVFVCYPLVGAGKLSRLLDLAERARVSTIADDLGAAEALGRAAVARGTTIDVLVKLDLGMHRVGVPEAAAPQLAEALARVPGLELRGVCIHEGETYGEPDPARRRALARDRVSRLVEAAEALRARGLRIDVVSAGATPSVFETVDLDGVTEMRPGNYVFFDAIGVALGVAAEDECALGVLTTVVSHSAPERAIGDAGAKALTLDRGVHGIGILEGFGSVRGRPGIEVASLSEEHGWLALGEGAAVEIGERLEVIPNHACPVVACFESLVLVRDGAPLERWRIATRGLLT